MSYAALLFQDEVGGGDDDDEASGFFDANDDDFPATQRKRTAKEQLVFDDLWLLLSNAQMTAMERLAREQRHRDECRRRGEPESDGRVPFFTPLFQLMDGNMTQLTPGHVDAVSVDDSRGMYELLKQGWPALKEMLKRETFHGTMPQFLARNVQHKLTQLFSRRQMGSERRSHLPLLAIDESRRDTLFRAHLAGAVSVTLMGAAEVEYRRRAHEAFMRHGERDEETGHCTLPRISDPETYAALRRSKALQLDFRRMACDSCQEWINSKSQRAQIVSLAAVVTLAPSTAGCRGNFDDVDEDVSSSNDDDANANDDDNDDDERPARDFRLPRDACPRNDHSLYVCIDCADRHQCAHELLTFLRLWSGCGELLTIGLLPSQMRHLCRVAAAVLLTLVDLAHHALRQQIAAVNRLDPLKISTEEAAEAVPVRYRGDRADEDE